MPKFASKHELKSFQVLKLLLEQNSQRRIDQDNEISEQESTITYNIVKFEKKSDLRLFIKFNLEVHIIDSKKFEFQSIINFEEELILKNKFEEDFDANDVDEIVKNNADLIFKPGLNKVSATYNSFIADSGLIRYKMLDVANAADFDEPVSD